MEHHHSDEPVPGWDAINAALEPVYGSVEPLHWGTMIRWRMGGPDPLDGTSAYRAEGPPPHWHFVSYGLSELYEKESDDPTISGWGIELTFRLRRDASESSPPIWALSFLQNLARYVFESGNVLSPGDHIDLNGPIALEEPTELTAVMFVEDPQLGTIDTPHGSLTFVQIVGLTDDEYGAVQDWHTLAFADLMRDGNPLLVTDLSRRSVLHDVETARIVQDRTATEGSSMGQVDVDVLAWSASGDLLSVTIGAAAVLRLHRMIVGRIRLGREFRIQGPDRQIAMQPGDSLSWHEAGPGVIHVEIPPPIADQIVNEVRAKAGTYDIEGKLQFVVEQTVITDQAGEEIDRIG